MDLSQIEHQVPWNRKEVSLIWAIAEVLSKHLDKPAEDIFDGEKKEIAGTVVSVDHKKPETAESSRKAFVSSVADIIKSLAAGITIPEGHDLVFIEDDATGDRTAWLKTFEQIREENRKKEEAESWEPYCKLISKKNKGFSHAFSSRRHKSRFTSMYNGTIYNGIDHKATWTVFIKDEGTYEVQAAWLEGANYERGGRSPTPVLSANTPQHVVQAIKDGMAKKLQSLKDTVIGYEGMIERTKSLGYAIELGFEVDVTQEPNKSAMESLMKKCAL